MVIDKDIYDTDIDDIVITGYSSKTQVDAATSFLFYSSKIFVPEAFSSS